MKLVIQADGREESVEVLRDGDAWRVTVGDAEYRLDAASLGLTQRGETAGNRRGASSLIFTAGRVGGDLPGGDLPGGDPHKGGDQYEISAHPLPRRKAPADSGDRYRVSLGASRPPVEVEVMDPLAWEARASHAGATGGGTQTVTAMMPGRVVTVLVEEGAEVAAGDGVLVLEAMKMENEITAESDGVVSRILVKEGQAVDGGEPLFEIGPPAGDGADGGDDSDGDGD